MIVSKISISKSLFCKANSAIFDSNPDGFILMLFPFVIVALSSPDS